LHPNVNSHFAITARNDWDAKLAYFCSLKNFVRGAQVIFAHTGGSRARMICASLYILHR
jgi:hypothetical protein